MQDIGKSPSLPYLHGYVDVVRHDAPGENPVAFPIEMKQCSLNHTRGSVVPQPAGAVPCIFVSIDAHAEGDLPGVGSREVFTPVQLSLPFLHHLLRHGTTQANSDELNRPWLIEMG